MTETKSGQCCWNDTWFPFRQWMFCDQSNSDLYNCHDEKEHPVTSHHRVYKQGWKKNQWKRVAQDYNECPESNSTTSTYLQAVQLGESRWVQQTPRFISSLTITLVTGKTSSLLRYNSSRKLPPLDCTWDQNDSQRLPTFPPVHTLFQFKILVYQMMTRGFYKHKTPQ